MNSEYYKIIYLQISTVNPMRAISDKLPKYIFESLKLHK